MSDTIESGKTSQRYVPSGAIPETDPDSGATVYSYERNGALCAIAYKPKASRNSVWHHRFRSEAERKNHITKFFEGQRAHQDEMKKRRANRKQPHSLKVGDILVSSWGYEQTNIDFYQVTAAPGKCTVELRELAKNAVETEWCRARVTPRKDKFVSAAFKRRASIDGRVKVSSVASAYVWDGRAKHQTSYA